MPEKGKYLYDWPRPMVTVDAVVFAFIEKRPHVLLIRRGKQPFKGKWALPGGFVEMDEELEHAAERELAEETGLKNVTLEQLRTFGKCGRDPRGRQISIAYAGIAQKAIDNIKGADDADNAKWFDIKKLPQNLAFDHDRIIETAINRFKHKKVINT